MKEEKQGAQIREDFVGVCVCVCVCVNARVLCCFFSVGLLQSFDGVPKRIENLGLRSAGAEHEGTMENAMDKCSKLFFAFGNLTGMRT